MPKLLNDVLVISRELEESYKNCLEGLNNKDTRELTDATLQYQEMLYKEVLEHLGNYSKPRLYNPEEHEIYPLALLNFKQEMDAYIAGLAVFIMAVVKENSTFFLSHSSFCWASDIFCMWEEGLQNSQIDQCVLSEAELGRRLQIKREEIEAEEQRLRDRAQRHKWLLLTAQVVGMAPAFFIPGAAVPIILIRIAVTGATVAALNAGFVAADNARTGEDLRDGVGNAALVGLKAGAVNATLGEGVNLAVGPIAAAWKPAVEQGGNAATSSATQSSQAVAEAMKHGGKQMATFSAAPEAQAVTEVVYQSIHFPYKGAIDVIGKGKSAEIEIQVSGKKIEINRTQFKKTEVLSAVQIQDQEQHTLFALLINSEISVFNQYTSLKDTVHISSYEEILTQMQRRLEKMLYLFKTSNSKLTDELEGKITAFEDRADETYHPLLELSKFATQMADWSEQFFDDPAKCSSESFKNPLENSSDIEQGKPKKYVPASSQKWEEYSQELEDMIKSCSLEEKIFALFDACKDEEKCLSILLDVSEKNDLSNEYAGLEEQEESYRANVSQYEAQIKSWLNWQKKMIPYLPDMQKTFDESSEIVNDFSEKVGGNNVCR